MPSLSFDHMVLFGVMTDPMFQAAMPGLDIREQVAKIHQQVVDAAMVETPGCSGCTSVTALVAPIMDSVGRWIEAASRDDKAVLIAYITRKRGYRPMPVVLYYRDERKRVRKLVF